LRKRLHDPLDSVYLRHLEEDIFVNASHRHDVSYSEEDAVMIWPEWEPGFSEVLMWTLLPIGYLAHLGTLPRVNETRWLISGALNTRSWEPLQRMSRGMCTFERHDVVENTAVRRPLPRCPPTACYAQLRLCMFTHAVTHTQSWLGRMALDAVLGFEQPSLRDRAVSARPRELAVLFAERHSWHGRHISNMDELVDSCRTHAPAGWRIVCRKASLGSGTLEHTIRKMRATDVFVSMHGGDLINAMHMLPGRTAIEVVNYGCHRAYRTWLDHYWLHLSPVVRHMRVVLPPLDQRAPMPKVDEAWNANRSLPLELFWTALNASLFDGGPAKSSRDARAPCPPESTCFGHYTDTPEGEQREGAKSRETPGALRAPDEASREGFCRYAKRGEGDCAAGRQGSWQLSRTEVATMEGAAHACAERCRACARCRVYSYSIRWKDCSWFHDCDLGSLSTAAGGFQTRQLPERASS
jgi:hypothetical protein